MEFSEIFIFKREYNFIYKIIIVIFELLVKKLNCYV